MANLRMANLTAENAEHAEKEQIKVKSLRPLCALRFFTSVRLQNLTAEKGVCYNFAQV